MTAYEETLKDLVSKLKELFQMDQADLDFGIYRVMKAKHDEIDKFLTKDLLPTVKKMLEATGKSENKQKELDEIVSNLRNAGIDPDTSPKVQELKALLENGGSNSENDAKDIFSNLITFFSRYYSGGDFMSLRRYKKDTYSPLSMNGEEVKLHWANADQYYIKSSENLTNYAFVDDTDSTNPLNVKFILVAATTEQNNNKSQEGERVFTLASESPFEYLSDKHELSIKFEYQVDAKKRKQKDINANIVKHIEKLTDLSEFPQWPEIQSRLLSLRATKANPKRTLIEKHLIDFTAKNKFDYFIHKDLGGFLNKELDYFIKSELVKLDDIIPSAPTELNDLGLLLEKQILINESQLKKIVSFKSIAKKIITFLAQLENFQKKLWLKKKFVLNCNYCLSLDLFKGTNELLKRIINEEQLKEWQCLFSLEVESFLDFIDKNSIVDITSNEKYRHLQIDTRFLTNEDKYELLSHFENIDIQTNAVLINSENFQALELLKSKERESIDYIYIDPPYNTNSTPIIYKNAYKHSSWLSLMNDRIVSAKELLTYHGTKTVAIDDAEAVNLSLLLEQQYDDYSISRITVVHNPKGSITRNFNRVHEYAFFLTKINSGGAIARTLEKNDTPRKMRRWGENSLRTDRRLSFYPIYVKDMKITRWGDVPKDDYSPSSKNILLDNGEIEVWPIDQNGDERRWNFGLDSIGENLNRIVALNKSGEIDLFLSHELTVPKTVWSGGEFDAGKYGNTLLIDMLGEKRFDFPKSINLVKRCIYLATKENKKAKILDYFGGSGTTGHATVEMNRADNGERKFILIEMGEYFSKVTKPRIQKAFYSSEWKNGKPQVLDGVSSCIKYMTLESYEDVLSNIELKPSNDQIDLLGELGSSNFKEQYILQYLLDIESKSQLINSKLFNSPLNAEILIVRNSKTIKQTVDLIETFNYLLGLNVMAIRKSQGIVEVVGTTNFGSKCLVLWRDVFETSNDQLDEWFKKQDYNSRDMEFDLIYVNGDNNLPNLKTDTDHWKVQLIETEFYKLMFDVNEL